MALPSSGQISMNDMNTDRGIASGTQIDLASAGTVYSVSYNTSGTDQLGMDEFYGKSIAAPPPPTPTPPTPPPATPTFAINGTPTVVDEGSSVTFTITTTNVPNGTVLYWTTNAPDGELNTPSAGDFTDGITQGSITINSNGATLVRTLVEDSATEGDEVFVIKLRQDSTSGNVVATSNTTIIADTSLSPPPPPPPPPPTCFLIEGVLEGSNVDQVCGGLPRTINGYFNAPSVETATLYYGPSTATGASDCTTPFIFTRYFIGAGGYYVWSGSPSFTMSGPFTCP